MIARNNAFINIFRPLKSGDILIQTVTEYQNILWDINEAAAKEQWWKIYIVGVWKIKKLK